MKIDWSSTLVLEAVQLLSSGASLELYYTYADPAIAGTGSVDDISLYEQYTAGSQQTNYTLIPDDLSIPVVPYSSDESIGIVNGMNIEYVSSGSCKVVAKADGYYDAFAKYNYVNPVFSSNAVVVATYKAKEYVAGTLGKHLYDNCVAMVAGFDPAQWLSSAIYSSYTNGRTLGEQPSINATRNLASFVEQAGIDTTGTSVMYCGYTSDGAYLERSWKTATVVTSRHLIGAKHWHGQVGDTYTFMKYDGTTVDVTILARENIVTPTGVDICVTYVDTDLTAAGLPIYKVMPAGWEALYAPTLTDSVSNAPDSAFGSLPIIRFANHHIDNSFSNAGARTGWHISGLFRFQDIESNKRYQFKNCSLGNLNLWEHDRSISVLEGGDSGCPSFLPIDAGSGIELVYIGSAHTESGHNGTSNFITEINAMLNATAESQSDFTGYSLTEISLPVLTTY